MLICQIKRKVYNFFLKIMKKFKNNNHLKLLFKRDLKKQTEKFSKRL